MKAKRRLKGSLFAASVLLALLPAGQSHGQERGTRAPAAGDVADFFSKVGDQIYAEDCIFELSEEQLEVQQALVKAYVAHGASSLLARQLATKQIQPPPLSERCEQIKRASQGSDWQAVVGPPAPKKPAIVAALPKMASAPPAALADRKVLPQWDCDPGIDYVTIRHKGYQRKLTGGEICKPFEDVVRAVPPSLRSFRLGYAIRTGRLFIVADDPQVTGRTIAWALSGRDVCRNNPDPECLAARAVGPLPPGEYSFASDQDQRVSWGPRTKRLVAGVYLEKLWHRDLFSPAQTAAILARGNIAIHARLKGEMSEACLGLEPNGWAYVSSLIKEGRATGLAVYIDEPYPQLAEAPPFRASSFSLSSLFK